ncbi:hypothetical protein RND81_13G155000 [Saponaria officinalis]|uniref:Uncharacterized protein n=1 Tax=Saponaria officinalis TaxID=3572 RepID=A0AAW1H1U9_SAPOF
MENIMESPIHEDELKVTRLVDYSSSSEDDNDENTEPSPTKGPNDSRSDTSLSQNKAESPAPLLKKQRLNDSVSDGNGSSNSDLEEKEEMDAHLTAFYEAKQSYTDSDEDFEPYDDNDVLQWGQYSWRRADRLYGREVYCVVVVGESPREESKCLELLDEIGCMERYLGCSVEMSSVFFANLIKDEAARLEGLDGVHRVIPRRRVISDI